MEEKDVTPADPQKDELPEGLYRPRYKDPKTGEVRESAIIWARYYRNGKKIRVSTETTSVREAKRFRVACVGGRRPVTTAVRRCDFEDLAGLVVGDYEITGHRSLRRVKQALAHLRCFFDGWLARDIGTTAISDYIKFRRGEHASNATLNREICALRRGFRLAAKVEPTPMVDFVPGFPRLKETSIRKGYFERHELDAVLAQLPEHLRAPMFTAFVTGWRVPSEILTRRRSHLNLQTGVLRLDAHESKTGEPREFPVNEVPELRKVLGAQLENTRALELKRGRVIDWLFHRNGQPIRHFYASWHKACAAAGFAGKIPHDFRRTAARNLIRGGSAIQVAKLITGHKTDSVFERYGIIDKRLRDEAAAKLAVVLESDRVAAPKVAVLGSKGTK
jgi:integrase